MKTNTHTNASFIVTKKISNANGFLLPSTLYDAVKDIATIPVKGFYLQDVPEFTDYKFKMHKNAFIKDKLTIQAQLVKQTTTSFTVNILVTKAKTTLNHHERVCSALFNFPVNNTEFTESKTAC
ncbi:hypothetical protein [Aestuariibaculum sediminum]|uniref:Uncharacterized protein n=1 Tax=Aestuariibaculum sediminum TaxID=2770637 RepID=A0A8J6U8C2_9FLAO|nr:hypothetical protein [Aestuariibaculum sediminum]MBD0833040.1 hypothetical protein [Aestuariibaculum sediminum]